VDKTTIPKGLLKQVYYNLYLPFDMGGNEIVVDEFQNNPAGENLCFWIVDRRMRAGLFVALGGRSQPARNRPA
jgi:hypothetical protein